MTIIPQQCDINKKWSIASTCRNINQKEAGDITYCELAVAVGDLGYNIPTTSSCYRYLKGIGTVTIYYYNIKIICPQMRTKKDLASLVPRLCQCLLHF